MMLRQKYDAVGLVRVIACEKESAEALKKLEEDSSMASTAEAPGVSWGTGRSRLKVSCDWRPESAFKSLQT